MGRGPACMVVVQGEEVLARCVWGGGPHIISPLLFLGKSSWIFQLHCYLIPDYLLLPTCPSPHLLHPFHNMGILHKTIQYSCVFCLTYPLGLIYLQDYWAWSNKIITAKMSTTSLLKLRCRDLLASCRVVPSWCGEVFAQCEDFFP